MRPRRSFYIVLILFNILLFSLAARFVSNRYSVLLYKKHARSQLDRELEMLMLAEADKGAGEQGETIATHFDIRHVHPYTGYKSQPSAVGLAQGQLVRTNALGYRSPELGARTEGVRRIAMIGGSVAFEGKRNETTIVARLAEIMTANGVPTEYINGGIVSGISSQEVGVLVHDVLDLKADIVIALDGFNDIYHVLHYNGRVGWPPFRWDGSVDATQWDYGQQATAYYPHIPPTTKISPSTLAATYERYATNIEKMAHLCESYGITFVAALQPYRNLVPQVEPEERLDPMNLFYQLVIDQFQEWDRERYLGGHYLSMADFFAGRKNRFRDDCHFGDEANREVAEYLYKLLVDRKLL